MRNVELQVAGDILIAELAGEIDHHNAGDIRKEIDGALEKLNIKNMIIDYTGVDFMDSSGIGLIMGRYKNINGRNGRLVIIPGSAYISRILGLSGIFGIVHKSRNIETAVEYISKNGGLKS